MYPHQTRPAYPYPADYMVTYPPMSFQTPFFYPNNYMDYVPRFCHPGQIPQLDHPNRLRDDRTSFPYTFNTNSGLYNTSLMSQSNHPNGLIDDRTLFSRPSTNTALVPYNSGLMPQPNNLNRLRDEGGLLSWPSTNTDPGPYNPVGYKNTYPHLEVASEYNMSRLPEIYPKEDQDYRNRDKDDIYNRDRNINERYYDRRDSRGDRKNSREDRRDFRDNRRDFRDNRRDLRDNKRNFVDKRTEPRDERNIRDERYGKDVHRDTKESIQLEDKETRRRHLVTPNTHSKQDRQNKVQDLRNKQEDRKPATKKDDGLLPTPNTHSKQDRQNKLQDLRNKQEDRKPATKKDDGLLTTPNTHSKQDRQNKVQDLRNKQEDRKPATKKDDRHLVTPNTHSKQDRQNKLQDLRNKQEDRKPATKKDDRHIKTNLNLPLKSLPNEDESLSTLTLISESETVSIASSRCLISSPVDSPESQSTNHTPLSHIQDLEILPKHQNTILLPKKDTLLIATTQTQPKNNSISAVLNTPSVSVTSSSSKITSSVFNSKLQPYNPSVKYINKRKQAKLLRCKSLLLFGEEFLKLSELMYRYEMDSSSESCRIIHEPSQTVLGQGNSKSQEKAKSQALFRVVKSYNKELLYNWLDKNHKLIEF